MRSVRRLRSVAVETDRTRRLDQVGVVAGAVRIVTAEAGHAARVHDALREIVALHPILAGGAVRVMQPAGLSERVQLELPEIRQAAADPEAERPVILGSSHRFARTYLRVA